MSFLSLPMLPVHGCEVVHTHLHRKKDSACLLSLSQVLPSCLNVLFYLCTCSRRRERDFLTWLIKGKGLTTTEHPQKSLKQHKNPGSPKISSTHDFCWLSDHLQGLVPHTHLSCETIHLLNSTPPLSTFRNGLAHTSSPSLYLSFSLAQPEICSSHTHLMQMPKFRNRERERVGGFVYLGSWAQLVLRA